MPLAAIRCYADLVRQGPGNEKDRLTLLRQHQQHVTSRIGQLTECLDLIRYKVQCTKTTSLRAPPASYGAHHRYRKTNN
jgi:hypothetical protein